MEDLKLIGGVLVNEGQIVTKKQLMSYLSNYSDCNKKISSLIKKGLLVKLKREKYYIAKIGSLGFTSMSNYIVANVIGEESYVSFEAALKYHGVFDQGISKYRSVSLRQHASKSLEGVVYEYVKVKEEMFFGFSVEKVDGGDAKIASVEKALLDMLEYNRTINTVSIVLEKMNIYRDEINFARLYKYSKNFSQTTVKTLGLLLDLLEIDSTRFEKLVRKGSTSHMLKNSNKFSNKWRIYYNSVIEKQLDD